MTPLPPVEWLSLGGIGFVALFGVWKTQVAPRLRARRVVADTA